MYTIILPVYGYSPWLNEALGSVLSQTSESWKLLVVDDGLDSAGNQWLDKKLNAIKDERVHWIKRSTNMGLFANLNQAIRESATDWLVLLCSDDKLHEHALSSLKRLHQKWPKAQLILSTFDSINSDGSKRPADNSNHHDQVRLQSGLVEPEQMIPNLLRLGSLNGNLTGMAFTKKHWLKTGYFREDWRHAADWEWVVRACEDEPILLNREPIAAVRTHANQLSNSNRELGHELFEVSEVVAMLKDHKYISGNSDRHKWSAHIMQFQLWNTLKATLQGRMENTPKKLKAIHKSAGLMRTGMALVSWLPERLNRRKESKAHSGAQFNESGLKMEKL